MDEFVVTREMQLGPVRVPVMVEKALAAELASFLTEHSRKHYDATLAEVLRLGMEACRCRTGRQRVG
ncbi:MAG: hypothetical protein MUC50_08690 [Myxococcota bacterium]|jgi:hypothetical protein|nr:hypothetical protein [Myxococcota bacterium]